MCRTVLKSESQSDKIEIIEEEPISKIKPYLKPKKFAIFGTKISESNHNFSEFLNCEANEHLEKILEEQSPKATEILSRILQNNLNTYNHLINYNYKTKVRNYEDQIKNNRLNFLLGIKANEKIFSIRPASLTELNTRLGKMYSPLAMDRHIHGRNESGAQTKMVNRLYNLSRRQQTKSGPAIRKSNLNSESVDSFKKLTGYNKLGFVDFNDQLDLN